MIAAEYLLLKPNWANKVIVNYTWQTSIQTAMSGREVRSALFTWPRRSIKYLITGISSEETNMIKRRIFKSLPYPFGVPFWPDGCELTSTAVSGSSTLSVDSTAYRNFEVGGLCVVMNRYNNGYEVGEVASVGGSSIGLASNLGATWTPPCDVWPVIQCRFKGEQSINFITSRVGQIRIDAEEVYDEDITYTTHGMPGSYPLYRQIPIMNTPPNWISRSETSFNHQGEWIQYLGKPYYTTYRDETDFKVKLRYTEFGRSALYNYIEFFNACMGRFDHFWTPTWNDDVRITSAFSSGATSIPIADYVYTDYWDQTEIVGKHLMFGFPDGTYSCSEVTGHSGNNITIDPGVPSGCTQDQANSMLVSFLILSRFNSDSLQIDYPTETIGNITSEFKSVFSPLEEGLPAIWQDAYSYSSWQGTSYGWTNYNMRVVIPAAELSGTGASIKVTLGYYDADYDVASIYIGHQGAGETIDFDGNQVEITFGGSSGTSVSTGGAVSDTVSFSLDDTKNLVVAMYFGTNGDVPSSLRSSYAGEVWYYGGSNETSSTDVDASSNYTDYSTTENIDVVEKIEIFTG